MATFYEIRQEQAGQEAYEQTYLTAIDATEADIAKKLTAAEVGLLSSMMAIADACGIESDERELLEADLGENVRPIVRNIFDAAVVDAQKVEFASTMADSAKGIAKSGVRRQQMSDAVTVSVDKNRRSSGAGYRTLILRKNED